MEDGVFLGSLIGHWVKVQVAAHLVKSRIIVSILVMDANLRQQFLIFPFHRGHFLVYMDTTTKIKHNEVFLQQGRVTKRGVWLGEVGIT